MMGRRFVGAGVGVLLLVLGQVPVAGQEDMRGRYERAVRLMGSNARQLVSGDQVRPTWLTGDRFWYRNNTGSGSAFMLVNGTSGAKRPAFDHVRLAAALSIAADTAYVAEKLPFETFEFEEGERAIRFRTDTLRSWSCDITATRAPVRAAHDRSGVRGEIAGRALVRVRAGRESLGARRDVGRGGSAHAGRRGALGLCGCAGGVLRRRDARAQEDREAADPRVVAGFAGRSGRIGWTSGTSRTCTCWRRRRAVRSSTPSSTRCRVTR
jgi:hypothetical protein